MSVFLLFLLNECMFNKVPGFFYFQVLLIRVGQFVNLFPDLLKFDMILVDLFVDHSHVLPGSAHIQFNLVFKLL